MSYFIFAGNLRLSDLRNKKYQPFGLLISK